jgi:predicted dehydrogenase
VCTPTPLHRPYTEKLASAGAHVFCEKPIAPTIEDAEAMVRAAKNAKVQLFIGHVLRFFQEYAAIKRILDEGKIGRPAVARASRCGAYPRGSNDWFTDYKQSGGALFDMSIHDIDFLNWCLGRPTRVFCRRHKEHLRDYALAIIRYESGAMAHVEGSWAHPGGFYTAFELAGSDGLCRFDSAEAAPLRVQVRAAEGKAPGVAVPESPVAESPYLLEDRHFVGCIEEGDTPVVTAADAILAARVALAAAQSAETGKAVEL